MKAKTRSNFINNLPNKKGSTSVPPRSCKYDLTIGMIVKNEERILRRTLEALKPLREALHCELIITDTGSTDNTIAISKEYADTFIQSDWCDDFSAARNSGASIAQGKWFMFLDADEVFDDTITQIIEFIQSPESDTYNCATYIVRNYRDKTLTVFGDFNASRLFNCSLTRRLFVNKVHEGIPMGTPVYTLQAIAHHDGYLPCFLPMKQTRNTSMLEEMMANNPTDLRSLFHLIDCYSEPEKKSALAQQGIALAKESNLLESAAVPILYMRLLPSYHALKEYDLAITTYTEYTELCPTNILPHLDILLELSSIYMDKKEYSLAIDALIKYQSCYIEITNHAPTTYNSLVVYTGNTQSAYLNSHLTIVNLYRIIKENVVETEIIQKSIDKYLALALSLSQEQSPVDIGFITQFIVAANRAGSELLAVNAYKLFVNDFTKKNRLEIMSAFNKFLYTKDFDGQQSLISYFDGEVTDSYTALCQLRANHYDFSICSPDVISTLKNDENLYDTLIFADAFYATLKCGIDILDFFANCPITQLIYFINDIFAHHDDVLQITSDRLEYTTADPTQDTKTLMFNAFLALSTATRTAQRNVIMPEITSTGAFAGLPSIEDTLPLTTLFDLYVNITYTVMTRIYNPDFITEENLDCMPPEQAFAYYAHQAIPCRDTSKLEYIRYLKKSIKYAPTLLQCVTQLVAKIENEIKQSVNDNAEFESLGKQVKASIREMMNNGQKKEADQLLIQYSQINPSDSDLIELLKEIDT